MGLQIKVIDIIAMFEVDGKILYMSVIQYIVTHLWIFMSYTASWLVDTAPRGPVIPRSRPISDVIVCQ